MEESQYLPHSLRKIIVLMYHRINDTETDPWGICVSPKNFEEHIQFLKNNFNIVSCKDLVDQVRTDNITDNSICLTFDDGYADNYEHAKPILEKYNCPATFFIPTAFIDIAELFWWDELELILLHSKKLPDHLLLCINGEDCKYLFDESELTPQQLLEHTNWKYYEEPPTDRCAAFLNIWKKLRSLSYKEINKQIVAIKKWAPVNDNIFEYRLPMNKQQLTELAENNLFTIGMHTHTHPDLQATEKQVQYEDILQCKKILDNKYGIKNKFFAYPYGRFNNDTIEVVNELKIDACFTTEDISIDANADLTRLGRYQVGNWNTAMFKEYLNTWSK